MRLLTELEKQKGKLIDAWARVLGLSFPGKVEWVWREIANVERLTKEVENQILGSKSYDPTSAMETIAAVRSLYFVSNWDLPLDVHRETLNRAIFGMRFVVDMLARLPAVERQLPDETIERHIKAIKDLIVEIESDKNLSAEIQAILIDLAWRMHSALKDYQRFGIGPAREAFGVVLARTATDPLIVAARTNESQRPILDRVIDGIKQYGIIVSAALNTAEALKKIADAIFLSGDHH